MTRDLIVYPVTLEEIRDCLLAAAAEAGFEDRMGDMRPHLLHIAARIVMRAGFVLADLNDWTGAKIP